MTIINQRFCPSPTPHIINKNNKTLTNKGKHLAPKTSQKQTEKEEKNVPKIVPHLCHSSS